MVLMCICGYLHYRFLSGPVALVGEATSSSTSKIVRTAVEYTLNNIMMDQVISETIWFFICRSYLAWLIGKGHPGKKSRCVFIMA